MTKFFVKETLPCYVTWTYEVEAADEDDALDKYTEGDHSEPVGEPEIGDTLDWVGACPVTVGPVEGV